MEKFLVTLSSDSPCVFNEQNNAAKFRVHLGRVIELVGKYEVALCEIYYPATLHNIRSTECFITRELIAFLKKSEADVIDCTNHVENAAHMCISVVNKDYDFEHHYKSRHELKSGYYHSVEDFLYDLNEQMMQFFNCEIEASTNKIILTCHPIASKKEKMTFRLSSALENILGFPEGLVLEPGYIYRAQLTCDLRKGLPAMLTVCTDLVFDQIVNNAQEKFLRSFHISPENFIYGFQRKETFSKLHFLPLIKKKIDAIDIYIKEGLNLDASFTHGVLKVVLLFRRVGNE
jgi:hypothetical protein